jgi:hypothetical protein
MWFVAAAIIVTGILSASSASGQSWGVFKSDKFGFAMLVAPGTSWAARDFGKGWGGIYARTGVVEFFGVAKLGTFAPAAELELTGVLVTGIPIAAWRKVQEGTQQNGWKWFKSYEARGNGKLILAVIGNGPRGSYLLLMGTTQADYEANKALYLQWYDKLTVY